MTKIVFCLKSITDSSIRSMRTVNLSKEGIETEKIGRGLLPISIESKFSAVWNGQGQYEEKGKVLQKIQEINPGLTYLVI